MDNSQIYRIRAELKQFGVPTKSITILKAILLNPGITNTELGGQTNMTKQAVSKHVNPLEQKGIIGNTHPHPLWKAWRITNDDVRALVSEMIPEPKQ